MLSSKDVRIIYGDATSLPWHEGGNQTQLKISRKAFLILSNVSEIGLLTKDDHEAADRVKYLCERRVAHRKVIGWSAITVTVSFSLEKKWHQITAICPTLNC